MEITPDHPELARATPPNGAGGPRQRPRLSVVAPAFNQAKTIHDNLLRIVERLETLGVDFELIVVSDGSADATYDEALRADGGRVRVLGYQRNLGKGYALRTGSAAARGDLVAWVDSDLDLDPASLTEFLAVAEAQDLDVVVGSKRHPLSVVDYPTRRRVYSWMYQQLVRALFSLDVRDTQVGMKLFRREVLEEVLPVVLVKRYAFDLEMLAVARRFGFERIAEAPIELRYQFAGSGVHWRAIAHALWDTAAVFYRLRLVRYYDARRVLAHRVALSGRANTPSLTVVITPDVVGGETVASVLRLLRHTPHGTRVIVAPGQVADPAVHLLAGVTVMEASGLPPAERAAGAAGLVETEVVAFIDSAAEASSGWATSALALLGDQTVGAVVGPAVSRITGSVAHDAAGVISESRIGVGGARVRHHVGSLREVGDYPARNLFVRTEALRAVLAGGRPVDDTLCTELTRRRGLSVLCSPDVVVTAEPAPLWDAHLRALFAAAVARGRSATPERPLRARHLIPVGLVVAIATGPVALAAGGRWSSAWKAGMALYGATVAGFGGTILVLHRRPRLAAACMAGAVASHVAAGAGILTGVAARAIPRRLRSRLPRPAGVR